MLIAYNALTLKNPKTGIPWHVELQLKNLLKYDVKNQYIVFIRKEFVKDFTAYTNIKIISVSLKCDPIMRILYEQLVIPFYLLKNRVELYFSTSFAIPIILKLFPKIKSIMNLYDLSYKKYPETMNIIIRSYYRTMIPFSVRLAKLIIVSSNAVANELKTLFGVQENKIKIANLGPTIENKQNNDISKFGIKDSYFFTIGRLEKRKNILNLLKGYKSYVESENAPHKLVLAGFSAYGVDEINKYISENNLEKYIIRVGHIEKDDLLGLYKNAVATIYPSIYEGFGLPILEAFIAGVPVLTSNVSSLPEVGGDAALYFDPFSPEDICLKIKEIAGNQKLRSSLIELGKARIQRFTWENHVKVIINAIEGLEVK